MNRIIDVSKARIPSVKVPIDNGGGTANVGDVLATKTFDSESGLLQVGTMPNYTAHQPNKGIDGTSTLGRIYVQPPSGHWGGFFVYADDPNFIAANIPASLSMFGLAGTGANVKRWAKITMSAGTGNIVISGLAFTPTIVMGYQNATNANYYGLALVANKDGSVWDAGAANGAYGIFLTTSATAFNGTTATWTSNGVTLTFSSSLAIPSTFYIFE